ncbi:hypothetical protein [Bdellovibrio sp. HCB337]|uniref:hypothetical protein n=1 Tax=Bdellovibrio sp. HCB337 TaxID=3394358 RepID=UPI0039A68325
MKSITRFCLSVFFGSVFSIQSQASEVDNFTLRGKLPDSRVWLNKRMNIALDKAAFRTRSCDMFALQKNLYRDLGGFFVARIETWSKKNPYAAHLPIKKSVYSDAIHERGDRGWRHFAKFKTYYSPGQFAFNDLLIGDDKLGHFLQMGYSMYFAVRWKKDPNFPDIRNRFQRTAEDLVGDYDFIRQSKATNPIDLMLDFSMFQENNEFGMIATMVRSYADITANYEGYYFWASLTEGENPYLRCSEGGWKRVRTFDWSAYINPGWDEAINCSDYDPAIHNKVQRQIAKRGYGQCPISATACEQLTKYYGQKVARKLLHPKCYENAH